jgi:oligogalacturonide lyase
LLSLGAGAIARVSGIERPRGALFPSERARYADPSTELEVLRLSDPAHTSRLPVYYNRFHARRNGFLLYASDRAGAVQAFRLDLKTGESRQLTDARALDPASLTLLPDERSFAFFDGPSLRLSNLSNLRERELYRIPDGWSRCPGATVSGDGQRAFFGERAAGVSRIRAVTTGKGLAATIAETGVEVSDPVPNPRRAQVLYRQKDEALWIVNFDGKQNRKLRLPDGLVGPARWSPDGRTVVYLHYPADTTQLNALREFTPDENTDKLIGRTSQFVHFGENSDASVFVGASRNRAAPYVLIFLRVTRRELTLCEHSATDPSAVAPAFSPDSQRIYFHSDRDGKPAIYCMRVEKFVENTDEGEPETPSRPSR